MGAEEGNQVEEKIAAGRLDPSTKDAIITAP